ncbi:MAG: CDP-diacylglycerol--serine O-phosphatidyltransferase [Deltaproteobacteria bacterium]|nr:CDP-diacylglycerol--serine O-phosphatidyltransferase [Deltaproteobacteria bacterium]
MKPLSKAKFLIPNMFTLGNLFCGYLAIFYTLGFKVSLACYFVLLGTFLDFVDGLLARKLNSQTKFGSEFDALADLLTCGMAPVIIAFHFFSQSNLQNLGIVAGFFYCAGIAIRLARFNSLDSGIIHFRGLPSPAAAVTLVSFAQVAIEFELNSYQTSLILIAGLFCLSLLAVSRLIFVSLKAESTVKASHKLLIALIFGFIFYFGWFALFLLSLIYVLSGPAIMIYRGTKFKLSVRSLETL